MFESCWRIRIKSVVRDGFNLSPSPGRPIIALEFLTRTATIAKRGGSRVSLDPQRIDVVGKLTIGQAGFPGGPDKE